MTTGTNIKDRCRLCYTRIKDTSSLHHKIWCSQHNNRIYNIYKRRPFRYRDLIVRYLCINLPETNLNDHYSNVICGTCATSLTKLETAYRTFDQTQKTLQSKFRKTSQIIQYQLDKKIKISSQPKLSIEQKTIEPKRLSKRKGAPKHIDQTLNNNNNKKPISSVQLIVKIQSPNHDNNNDDDDDEREDESVETTQNLFSSSSSLPRKRTSPRRKHDILTETTNQKKKFKRSTKDSELTSITSDTLNYESYNCINLLKPSTSTDTSIHTLPSLNLTTPGSSSSSSSIINSRPFNSVKGNHIERIAVSLLSGTETLSDNGINNLNVSNGINDHLSDHNSSKTRTRRKPTSSLTTPLEVTTTNNILSTTYTNVATILSPSLDDADDDGLSTGDISNDDSNLSTNGIQQNGANIPNVNKHLSSTISTTPTAEGLTITAINTTGQKQVFMAKQLGNLKKYQCGLCEKIVTNIQIHVRRHTNDKPYPCTYCEKRFTNSGDLQIHVRIHTGEKPYACPLCLKSYRTIGNFNSHVKTHDSGVRPHRCELCDQIFPIPKDWYSHLRSSHRSRIPNNSLSTTSTTTTTTTNSSSSLNSTNATTTVTQPLFSNALSSQQQHNEIFVPNKVKLEPINRSQLIIKSSNVDDQEPVNMSKKENSNDIDENEENNDEDNAVVDDDEEEDDDEENHHQSTHNLLTNVSSPVHA
ncbi:unnamed protein product [Adineta steineri]|uniref:Uncharacterized protein n=1 Tax=Adineta steineri TaxID=433720 RepID=A0A819A5X0_9BILA|nr:unnamed protein product [Adineta steineri]CAF3772927.1 unnamed protein product [Adineta steineri]